MLTCALESLEHTQLCNVEQANAAQDYFCPECKQAIRKRQGQNRAHFYHYQGSQCKWATVSWAHLKTQLELAARFIGFLEKRFSSIERIADVFIPSKALVIEVQYSPITIDEVIKRNWDYSQIGLQVLWILQKDHPLSDEFGAGGALFHVPHYFCDMESPSFVLYDLIEGDIHVIKKPKIRLKEDHVFLTLDAFAKEKAYAHLLWQRHTLWKCGLKGDILESFLSPTACYEYTY